MVARMSGRLKGLSDKTLGRFFGFAPLALACFVSLGFASSAQAACSDPAEYRVQWQNCDKNGAKLNNANLIGAKLEGTDLRKADLTKANLSGADLSEADLRGSILDGTILGGANLDGADLTKADLRKANLRKVDLSGAYLKEADLYGADLTGTNLTTTILEGTNLNWTNLTGKVLTKTKLRGAKLRQAYLIKADLTKADLSHANMTMADLTGAILKGADLYNVILVGTKLSNADLSGATWKDGRICAEGSIGECKFTSPDELAGSALTDLDVSNEIQSAAVTEFDVVTELDVVTTHSNGLGQALEGNANAPTARGTLTISFCPDDTLRDDRNCADEPADGSGGPETASGPLPGLAGSTPDDTGDAGPEVEPVDPSDSTVIVTISPRALGAGRQSREGVPIPYGPETLSASGGTPPYLFSLEDGTLPKGVELGSTGLLDGFAEQAGTFPITVAARDAIGVIGQRAYEINIRIPGTIIAPISVGTLTIGLPPKQSRLRCYAGNAKLSVTPDTLPVAMVGQPYGPVDLIIVGGESPYSLRSAESFGLSAGLEVTEIPDATSGDGSTFQRGVRISGVPEQASKTGETGIELMVLDTCISFIAPQRIIEILAPLSTTPDNLPDGTVGVDYGPVDVMISGGKAPYTVAFTPGALPDGLTIITLADDTAGDPAEFHKGVRISGVPTQASDGDTVLLLAITDAAGYKLARPYTVAIAESPVLQDPMTMTPDTLPDGIAGSEYGPVDLVFKGGTPPYNVVVNKTKLPAGLTVSELENGNTFRLEGSPQFAGNEDSAIVLNAVDAKGNAIARIYALKIDGLTCSDPKMSNSMAYFGCQCPQYHEEIDGACIEDFQISPPELADGTQNVPYYEQLIINNDENGPYEFIVTSNEDLPDGMTLSIDGSLFGTPTGSGGYDFTVEAVRNNVLVGIWPYTLVVAADPVVLLTAELPAATVAVGYEFELSATGGAAPYEFALVGASPDGFELSSTGLLSGVPNAEGPVSFTARAKDANGNQSKEVVFSIAVKAALCPLPGMMASFNSDSTEQCQCKPTLYPFEQGNGCGPCADGQKPFGGTCPAPVKTFVPIPVETKATCSGGMVLKSSGVCGCPSARPDFVDGACKAPPPPPKKKAPKVKKPAKSAPKARAPAAPRAPATSAPAPRECNVFVLALQCGLIDRTSNVGTCSCGGPLPSNNPAPQRAPTLQRPAAPQGPTCEQNCANQYGFGTEGHEICMMNQC